MKNFVLNKGEILKVGNTIHEYVNTNDEVILKSFVLEHKETTYNIVGYVTTNCIITGDTITALNNSSIELYYITDLKDNWIIKNAIIGYEFNGELRLKGFNSSDWE